MGAGSPTTAASSRPLRTASIRRTAEPVSSRVWTFGASTETPAPEMTTEVGAVSPARAQRRTTRDRLRLALELLRDDAFDALLTSGSRFEDLPVTMARLVSGAGAPLCHVVEYARLDDAEGASCSP